MRYLLIIILLGFASNVTSHVSENTTIASCCTTEGRGCNGSSYCKACKNCTGCKHCAKNGGTCGVCSSGNKRRTQTYTKSTRTQSSATVNAFKASSYSKLKVTTTTLNLRDGPTAKSKIIQKLNLNTELFFLEVIGDWIKVEVINTKVTGYVYVKFVALK